jgi:hypothetical protein
MKSSLVLGLLAAAAAWFVYRKGYSNTRKVPVNEAAALLRAAWAKNHTLA